MGDKAQQKGIYMWGIPGRVGNACHRKVITK